MTITKNTIVGVVGAGAMGTGITQVAAMAGHRVVLCDENKDALDKAKKSLITTIQKLHEKGKIPSADEVIQRFSFEHKITAFKDCGLVIEAIIEKL